MKHLLKSCAKQIPQVKALLHQRDELLARVGPTPDYHHDGLSVWGKSVAFLDDPKFLQSYQAGMQSGHKIGRNPGSTDDIHIEWRAHVCCWAAYHAKHLPGDFVECGVNTGIFSLTICNYINFNSTGKSFYLFDTFNGIPQEQMSDTERPGRIHMNRAFYEECYGISKKNFAPFPKAVLIKGKVPDTLRTASIEKVCYLAIDMNIVLPEIAAIKFFWDLLVAGAPVILDDYGWSDCIEQKRAMDAFAADNGVMILELPTGQGLLIKP